MGGAGAVDADTLDALSRLSRRECAAHLCGTERAAECGDDSDDGEIHNSDNAGTPRALDAAFGSPQHTVSFLHRLFDTAMDNFVAGSGASPNDPVLRENLAHFWGGGGVQYSIPYV
jgi:hypothetical protein